MGIISWIILGVIAGFIGSKIVNKTGQGLIMDIVLGIVGAIVGGLIFSAFGATGVTGLNIWSLIVAVIGAVVVLWAYHQFSRKRTL
ncbi:GlsB/YeaQ/YmgE family stress response membrane protein [Mesorhizobium sp. M0514]|uniref:GlsB/YeaQ/YmgE family stress response membrane protein n=1 Tax=Mesorhizobium sp. M0514 TaxID=2956955 RepID=UPI0033380600